MNIFRILARTFSALLVLLVGLFVVGEAASGGLPNFSRLPTTQVVMFVSLGVSIAGLIIGWFGEGAGGWMAFLGAAVFIYMDYTASGHINLNWLIIAIGATGLLFVMSSMAQPVRSRR